jgi:DNA-3-methyladenine glycosylase II
MITQSTSLVARAVPLPVTEPFDFGHTLGFLERFPAMSGEQQLGRHTLSYALRADGRTIAVSASEADGGLSLELIAEEALNNTVAAEVCDRVGFFLGAEDDLSAFYERAAGDAAFEHVIDRLRGYHQVKFPSPLELLVWAILGQRVPMPVARTMKHAIVARFDNQITVDGVRSVAFPDAAQLAELTNSDYVALIRNERKASYLVGAVAGFAALDETFLRTGQEDAVRDALLALPGIGPWSAGFLMIRGLGRMGTLSPDKEGKRAASRVYGHEIDDAEFRVLADRYGPWQGYWGHYLRVGGI